MNGDREEKDTARLGKPRPPDETQSQLRPAAELLLNRDRGTLTVVAGPQMGTVLVLEGTQKTTIGRGDDVSLRVDDPGLSRRHASVENRPSGFFLRDLGSKNGTYVEGEAIEGVHRLEDGDRIQLGQNTLLKFSLQDPIEQEAARQVYEWTMRDPLTGAYNRRYLGERMREEIAFAIRHQASLSVLLLDVDHFKETNDSHGHPAGDVVLAALARFLQRALRTEDVAARYGGEEFAILLRDIGHEGATVLAERLRRSVAGLPIPWKDETISVTVSIGVATYTPGSRGDDADAILAAADEALYRAKEAGRNRVSD